MGYFKTSCCGFLFLSGSREYGAAEPLSWPDLSHLRVDVTHWPVNCSGLGLEWQTCSPNTYCALLHFPVSPYCFCPEGSHQSYLSMSSMFSCLCFILYCIWIGRQGVEIMLVWKSAKAARLLQVVLHESSSFWISWMKSAQLAWGIVISVAYVKITAGQFKL